jgi:hypothetical protein
MTPKEKAEALVNSYRFILMNEDTECGNEILCTSIAKQFALITVDEVLGYMGADRGYIFWEEVKSEIEKL